MTEHDTPTFVRASKLYCVETSTTYDHPDQQATDSEIAEIFDLTPTGPAIEEQPEASEEL